MQKKTRKRKAKSALLGIVTGASMSTSSPGLNADDSATVCALHSSTLIEHCRLYDLSFNKHVIAFKLGGKLHSLHCSTQVPGCNAQP